MEAGCPAAIVSCTNVSEIRWYGTSNNQRDMHNEIEGDE